MFGLLVFFFKLFFSTFFAILFSYFIAEEEENNINIILFAILGSSLSLIVGHSSIGKDAISISILAFSILYLSYNYFNVINENKKLLFLFPGLIGLLVGFGLILESVLVLLFLYIAKNSLAYIYESSINSDDNSQKTEKKINNIK